MIVPDKQEKIKDWFDKTYSLRGQSYLRPKEAYQILINHLKPQSWNVSTGAMLEV